MKTPTGKFFRSVSGGFAAFLTVTEHVPGYIFIQAENYDDFEVQFNKVMSLHFRPFAPINDWVFASMELVESSHQIGFTQTTFSSKSIDFIVNTHICEQHSCRNADDYVTYSIGQIRFTMPKLENSNLKPELVNELMSTIVRALTACPRTKDQVDDLIKLIFARND